MQDISEQQDFAREISDAISRPASDAYDEVHHIPFFQLETCFLSTVFKVELQLSLFPQNPALQFPHLNHVHCLFFQDELLAELAELEQEELEESMSSMDLLPSVPSSRLPSQPNRRGSKCKNATTSKERLPCIFLSSTNL